MTDTAYKDERLGEWESFLLGNDLSGASDRDFARLAARSALRTVQFFEYSGDGGQTNRVEIGRQCSTHPDLVYARFFLNLLLASEVSEPSFSRTLMRYEACFRSMLVDESREQEFNLLRCVTRAAETVLATEENNDPSSLSVETAAACLAVWKSYPPRYPDSTQYEADIKFAAAQRDLNLRPLFGSKPTKNLMGFGGNYTAFSSTEKHFDFFEQWHRGFIDGKPLDWRLQQRVARIPNAIWEEGPEQLAREIQKIQATLDAEKASAEVGAVTDNQVSKTQSLEFSQRLAANRNSIALLAAGQLEQVSQFRETVRGSNRLDAKVKSQLLNFLDELTNKFHALLELIPEDDSGVDEQSGEKGVRWLDGFKKALLSEAHKYVSPENVADAVIPTGIILGCTGLASLLGMPVAGTVVGGLLTGQLKPSKAADEVLKPTRRDPEP